MKEVKKYKTTVQDTKRACRMKIFIRLGTVILVIALLIEQSILMGGL